MRLILPAVIAVSALSACDMPDPTPAYSTPEAAGLVAMGPYPGPEDVCQAVGESPATAEYLDHTATLVACPAVETGAIADRVAEGGTAVATAGDWVLISIPTGI